MVRRASAVLIVLIGLIAAGASGAAPGTVTVSGKVLDPHGRPAGAATVFVSVTDSSDPYAEGTRRVEARKTTTAADGAFRLAMPVESAHWWVSLTAVKAGYGPGMRTAWPEIGVTGLAIVLGEPGSLAGRVVDAAGQPVAGARVRPQWLIFSHGDGGDQIPEAAAPAAVTDARGRFRLASLPAHCRVVLAVEHPRYVLPLGGSDEIRTGQEEVRIALAPAGTITGRVVGDDGRPAAGMSVLCLTTATSVPPQTTDPEGRFHFAGLLPGAYLLLPQPTEAMAGFDASPERVVLPAGGEVRCPDLTLKRLAGSAVLSGKVTDAATGQPIADVGIITQRQIASTGMLNMPIEGPAARTGADGRYRLRLPPGGWHVYAALPPPGYQDVTPPSGVSELTAGPGKTLTRDFTLARSPHAMLAGQVRGADGQPVPGAKLRAMPGGVAFTDVDGRFRLPILGGRFMPPTFRLAVLSPDRTQGTLLDVSIDTVIGPRVLRLHRLPMTSGVLIDERDAPLPHVEVRDELVLAGQPGKLSEFAIDLAATDTDARGRFSLPLVPGAACYLRTQPEGFVPLRRLVVRQGAERLALRLQRGGGTVAGVAVDSNSRPLAGVQVTAWAPGQYYYPGVPFARATTDALGQYRLEHLPRGAVNVNAWLSGYYDDHRQNVKVGVSQLRLLLAPMSRPAQPPAPLPVGARAPEIHVAQWVNGAGPASLAVLRGKRVLLQFSSAYNRAADAANTALAALAARLKAAGRDDVVILALYDNSASAGDAAAYARAEGLPFPIGRVEPGPGGGLDSPTFQAYGVQRLPTLFLIDRDGVIRAVDPPPAAVLQTAAPAK